jgi:hypothetical protein
MRLNLSSLKVQSFTTSVPAMIAVPKCCTGCDSGCGIIPTGGGCESGAGDTQYPVC